MINQSTLDDDPLNVEITYDNNFLVRSSYKHSFFNTLFLNIRGLRSKLYDLTNYIANHDTTFHIVVLNETFLKQEDEKFFNLPGYFAFHSSREKFGGGASIFVLNSFSGANVVVNETFENSSFLLISLDSHAIRVGTVYRPPDANSSSFFQKLEQYLNNIEHLFLFGDFNFNLLDTFNKNVVNYRQTIESNGLRFLNSLESHMHTRYNQITNSFSTIDHVITDDFPSYKFHFLTESILNSDHNAILLKVFHHQRTNTIKKGKLLSFQRIDHHRIISENQLRQISSSSFEEFVNDFKTVLAKNSVTTRVKEKFRKPFMNKEIYDYMIIRDNYKKLRNKFSNSILACSRYKSYRNLVVTKLRE